MTLLLACWLGPKDATAGAKTTHDEHDGARGTDRRGPDGEACRTAATLARTVHKLPGSLTIEDALRSVGLAPTTNAGKFLQLGLSTVWDLKLLAGGPEAAEALEELKRSGMTVGDRAKARLLVGDRDHIRKLYELDGSAAGHHFGTRISV
eukprot:SAG31_NODE_11906_length_987_cov_1.365991_1_plen_149_part_10